MKRFWFLAVLMALSSSAHAGSSLSFSRRRTPDPHRGAPALPFHLLRLDVDLRHPSNWRRKRDRYDDERDAAAPVRRRSPPAPAAGAAPSRLRQQSPPAAVDRRAAAGRFHTGAAAIAEVAAPLRPCAAAGRFRRPPPPAVLPFQLPPVAAGRSRTVAGRAARAAGSASLASMPKTNRPIRRSATGRPKARERFASNAAATRCAAIVLDSPSNDKGEAILINMKPKTRQAMDRQRLQPGQRRDLLRHDGDEGHQHAARRSLRARPLLLLRQ